MRFNSADISLMVSGCALSPPRGRATSPASSSCIGGGAMNILLLGSGGREHALAWQLAQSPACTRLYAAPGNPGIAEEAECAA
ncbi:MAG: phosphoribosylamine--glycine ligase N-terminal domain-containing protein, partial [Erythrobacter sp.]|nr:phosphoribosylamine--glycine ligase N-terminal domain-containing protein [Erythrobacter sp.]